MNFGLKLQLQKQVENLKQEIDYLEMLNVRIKRYLQTSTGLTYEEIHKLRGLQADKLKTEKKIEKLKKEIRKISYQV